MFNFNGLDELNSFVNYPLNQDTELAESTIMLVDDEPVMLDIVQALLEDAGYSHFLSVQHSVDAIAAMEEGDPDILLLDLDMPEMDGFEVLTQVRQHPRFCHLPVIILTAAEDPDSKLRALELGATDFLSKPVDPSELGLRVRNTLSAKAYQDQLAYYDSLTGLPNQKLFIERLSWALKIAEREQSSLVILDIGLNRVRSIYETLGKSVGDQVLISVAERLKHVIRSSDIVVRRDARKKEEHTARVADDEFCIILCGIQEVNKASTVCKRILEELDKPFRIDGRDLYVTTGIGMSVYPDDSNDLESLMKYASAAKEHAKKEGAGHYLYYSTEMNAQSLEIINMEADLKKALNNGDFELHFQPKVDIHSGATVGVESLIRWNHPDQGNIPPYKFIPVAEDMGIIVALGEWVLNEACKKVCQLNRAGFQDLNVSVNVAAKQFEDRKFKESISSALDNSGLDPNNLILEITESTLMGDIDHIVGVMQEIESLGVSFSLDDFGTGYSSLSYLKRFPIKELKIDRSFLIEIASNQKDQSIVKAIVALARHLDQKVVAEGVEDESQLEFLRQNHCDLIQGYHFSKPLRFVDLVKFLGK